MFFFLYSAVAKQHFNYRYIDQSILYIIHTFASNWQRCANVLRILSQIRMSANMMPNVVQICMVAKMNSQWLPSSTTKFASNL